MKVSEILDKAADLIEPEGAWTQGPYARDANGRPCFGNQPGAVCFCALGALQHLGSEDAGFEARHQAETFCDELFGDGESLIGFNEAEGRTQPEVVSFLRGAAHKAREAGI